MIEMVAGAVKEAALDGLVMATDLRAVGAGGCERHVVERRGTQNAGVVTGDREAHVDTVSHVDRRGADGRPCQSIG